MIHHALAGFYRTWHGSLHLKGAGALLTKMAPHLSGLQHYQLRLPDGHDIEVDFRDVSAMYWLNHLLNDIFEEQGLLAAIRPFLRGKGVFWDIGANSGLLSYSLLKSEDIGEMHMFEPNPKMGRLAAQAVAPFHNVTVHPYGLSDKNADFILTVPHGHTTMALLNRMPLHGTGSNAKSHVGWETNLFLRTG